MRRLFLNLLFLCSATTLSAAESSTETFSVTVEPNEDISITGTPTFTFSYNNDGTMVAEDTNSTMDFQSAPGETKVLNVKIDSIPTGMTISTWVDTASATTGPAGTIVSNNASSSPGYTLTLTDYAIFTGLDDYSFTAAPVGYRVVADPSASTATQNLTVTWTIST